MKLRLLTILALISIISAQTTVNPDFSVIGQTRIQSTDSTAQLNFADIELALTGYLNPFARADVYLHKHDVSAAFELEEAVITLERFLPLGTEARIGLFKPNFGAINQDHAHTWSHIHAPVGAAEFLGEEMWMSGGAEFSWFMPLPWAADLSLGAFQSAPGAHDHGHRDEHDHEAEAEIDEETSAYVARLGHFFDLSTSSHLEAGSSIMLNSENETKLVNLESKFKWKPDSYRSLTLQSELFLPISQDAHEEHADDEEAAEEHDEEPPELSAYFLLDYQWQKRWNAGLLLDLLKVHEETSILPGAFIGFDLGEESSMLRIVVKQEEHEHEETHWQVTGQLLWSLGPHKAHKF